MKAALRNGLLLLVTICQVRSSVSLPNFNDSIFAVTNKTEIEILDDDVDLLLRSVADALPSEMRLDNASEAPDEECSLHGLRNSVKRKGDAAVLQVTDNEVLISFDVSMNETEVRCVRKEEDRPPVVLRRSWWKKVREGVKKAVKVVATDFAVKVVLSTVLLDEPRLRDVRVMDLQISGSEGSGTTVSEETALLKKLVDGKEKISKELEETISEKLRSL
ncbi:uncharacterized protein LOC135223292 [Macrobrachium nipponense]|uniref:uncharacterized protein LOC135223292 n=1 Tax=Macrobrachium nipponense TaxID=159736 RepID=UPI0030C82815